MSASGSLIGPTNSSSDDAGVTIGAGEAGAVETGMTDGAGPAGGEGSGVTIGPDPADAVGPDVGVGGAPRATETTQAARLRRKGRRLMQGESGWKGGGPNPGALMKGESPRHVNGLVL